MFLHGLRTLVHCIPFVLRTVLHPHIDLTVVLMLLILEICDWRILVAMFVLWWLRQFVRLLYAGVVRPRQPLDQDEPTALDEVILEHDILRDPWCTRVVDAMTIPLSVHYVLVWCACVLQGRNLLTHSYVLQFLPFLPHPIDWTRETLEATHTDGHGDTREQSSLQQWRALPPARNLRQQFQYCDVSLCTRRRDVKGKSECTICLRQLRPSRQRPYARIRTCGHQFHPQCLLQWIYSPSSNAKCPLCRARFVHLD